MPHPLRHVEPVGEVTDFVKVLRRDRQPPGAVRVPRCVGGQRSSL